MRPRLVQLVSLVLCGTLVGCYSTATVPQVGLGALRAGGHSESTVVFGEKGEAVRLDANSKVRFLRADGSFTPFRRASDLTVGDDGVFILRKVAPREIAAARVEGLSEAEVEELRAATPTHGRTWVLAPGVVELSSDGGMLGAWVWAFATRVGKIPGIWTLHLSPSIGPFDGPSLDKVLREGTMVVDGLRWKDVTSAEVENLEGGETAVAVVAITAIAIGIIVIAAASKGNVSVPGKGAAHAVGHVATAPLRAPFVGVRVGAHVAASTCCYYGAGTARPVAAPPREEPAEDKTLARPGFELPWWNDARPVFTGSATRRSTVGIGLGLDVGRDVSQEARLHTGVSALLRFVDFFEIGGGLRWIASPTNGTQSDVLGYFKIGVHGEIDAYRRFALPFGFEVGRGRELNLFARMDFGLRVRAYDDLWLGFYPFNPTVQRWDGTVRAEPLRWSFPSSVEVSMMF